VIKKKQKPENSVLKTQTILGIDVGETNVGIALGRNGLAVPLKTIPAKDKAAAINEIVKLVHHNKVEKLIVGIPLTHEGKETPQARKVRQFSKLLKIRVKKPVEYVDEHGSSLESVEKASEDIVSKKKRRVLDHFSAAIILKRHYDSIE
jgi:putative holliday junction resolvase